ncbi:hypothetical protein [Trueperella sp. LYQ143]|uniref:hypothetical protein n=1 Tax=Trueperella sp. LYQ143 TaxID=3391059 RepID=UPI003983CAF1
MVQYVTDIHALNLASNTETTGDWHASAIQWRKLYIAESDNSLFGLWGIELNSPLPIREHEGQRFNIANHLRALLDIIAAGRFPIAHGMRKDYIGNDAYNDTIFSKVLLLRHQDNWPDIDAFMRKEYGLSWMIYLKQAHNDMA